MPMPRLPWYLRKDFSSTVKLNQIGSMDTIVVSRVWSVMTMLPSVTSLRLIRPSMGERTSVKS